ncbi:hypothetical protein IRP63_16325 [Clostridium phage CWou-2020a]|uniref:Uncharacterized protein n=1 Tax=Clostridium botulinum C/D str. DC5 TaxID=1443128 RepID=A0A0A0IMT4_CLOBO|nr:hypothetical protein [Clostridium botulinum]QPW59433.1 hypothetical protein IRP63_16325 [Clostridium phage CWou-2020a]KGN00841.1 hypothetical protein Z955_02470 [Clostridium botulinum C/D str. DC5]KOC54176.1 hypothetical protein ADU90_12615 [Clostridium botulinum]KOC56520.1 hypothetical protein ADU89_02625 [Clostridium botulinum]MCD3240901.1 hypothetical protein [Clostridium botulinum D/C]
MGLRKDDPVYYKLKLRELIEQAKNEGLRIQSKYIESGARINFIAKNGDVAGVDLGEKWVWK